MSGPIPAMPMSELAFSGDEREQDEALAAWSTPGIICVTNWPGGSVYGESPNCILQPIAGRSREPGGTAAETSKKKAWSDRKSALNSNTLW